MPPGLTQDSSIHTKILRCSAHRVSITHFVLWALTISILHRVVGSASCLLLWGLGSTENGVGDGVCRKCAITFACISDEHGAYKVLGR